MNAGKPRQVLSLFDAVAIIVGLVIGAGIFRLPSLVAMQIDSGWIIIGVWVLGGLISLIGALCFAELATAYPHPGGEYHYLTRAFGRDCGFMFAWARMSVVQTGSIALFAYIFGDYASELLPLGPHSSAIWAAGAVVCLTALNIAGVRQTKTVQNLLFAATLLGLSCIVVAGLLLLSPAGPSAAPDLGSGGGSSGGITGAAFGLAMVFVLLTYGGWNEAAYISAEVRDGRRNMVRALLIGIGLITLVYVAVNFVYVQVLGPAGMASSSAVARNVMDAAFGPAGSVFITVLIMLVVLTSLNVTIFTGARTNFALGRDFPLFGFLAQWSEKGSAPVRALLFQAAIALALVLLGAMRRDGFETMVEYLSPVFWLFFLLTGLALFVLRRRDPGRERPFRVPLYPVTPALFCVTCAYLLYSSLNYTGTGAFVGVAVLLLGLPLLFAARRSPAPASLGSD
ncbi:MAG: APC family permease [Alphaproteobacteria bacterium]